MDDFEQAWNDYYDNFMRSKNEIMSKLMTIKTDIKTHQVYRVWLDQAIEFIKEQKG